MNIRSSAHCPVQSEADAEDKCFDRLSVFLKKKKQKTKAEAMSYFIDKEVHIELNSSH